MSQPAFTPYDQVAATFEKVLETSPADETELVWFERKYGVASTDDSQPSTLEAPRLTVLIRVVEGGRQGWHRTDSSHVSELETGLRQALALAKVQPKVKKRPVLPTDKRDLRFAAQLLDREVSELEPQAASEMVRSWCGQELSGRLDWSETRLAVFNNHGLRRAAASSELSFGAECNGGRSLSRAAGSARSLQGLDAESICARARHPPAEATAELPTGPVPVLLEPEAVIALLNVINTFALAGRTYLDGTSFLVRHRNVQVFDRSLNLRDDGHREPGVPFPFDLEGSPKRSLDLVVDGQPSVVALNQYQGAEAGMQPTAQAVGGQDALFGNLFLLPGDTAADDLLAAAEGGIRIGWLDPPECFEPSQLKIRTTARCVRRIENGRLGAALPDFVWEESLLRALARLRAVGHEGVVHSTPTTPLGAISAPALVLADSEGFHSAG
ncbi:MAG: metallopeptidase TldD-related protein [Acidobacteriota bacterium]